MTELPTPPSNPDPSRNPRILIVGNAGQLGRELEQCFADVGTILAVDRESVDLADADQTRDLVRRAAPDIILNAAAYTAVDRAESEMPLAHAINALAPRVLAEEAAEHNALLVHYSTDYVFDGSKQGPWTEDDAPAPLNVYGANKLAGEEAIQNSRARYLIFRTSWVYGPHGNNFLLTMLRLAAERDRLSIVNDQIGAPTTSIELARSTREIVTGVLAGRFGAANDWSGLYHMTCAGSVSWFGFAQAIFARASERLGVKEPELIPIGAKDYPTPAARPRNSVLSNAKLNSRFGVQLPSWQSALDEVIARLQKRSGSA
ncbi:MAG: dTDP-4-dehydrorhamnose reductase [Terracidiphilus sp.]|jgi:dTDP-4-dehydrorhamnose reductase